MRDREGGDRKEECGPVEKKYSGGKVSVTFVMSYAALRVIKVLHSPSPPVFHSPT